MVQVLHLCRPALEKRIDRVRVTRIGEHAEQDPTVGTPSTTSRPKPLELGQHLVHVLLRAARKQRPAEEDQHAPKDPLVHPEVHRVHPIGAARKDRNERDQEQPVRLGVGFPP